ncbi:Ig domain-containing protein [Cohnella sp. GCM10027633]|uniref:Ig-like domain-containing protein n=1 Tax=unclassified Cohnella TaxID=2636738 RepID=UPI003641F3B7
MALTIVPFSSVSAADETVTGLDLESVSQPLELTVEGDPVTIVAWATVSGTSAKKDVSSLATWTSSSSSVKVSKGVITATGAVSSATITAKYQGFTDTLQVKAVYQYKEVKLELAGSGADAGSAKTVQLDEELKLIATGVEENGSEKEVTEDALWSTSNGSVATVDDGEITLVGVGTATITAKHKGRSDTLALTVESPYSEVIIGSAQTLNDPHELNVGDADLKLTATAVPKSGSATPITITNDATWTSSNGNVVKVDKGVVTAVGAGSAVVTVKRFGVSDTMTFHVRTLYEAMKLTPNKPIAFTLYGAGVELSASVSKGTDEADDITDKAEWKTADSFVAAIVKTGTGIDTVIKVVPKSVGTTKVSVTYKGLTKEQTVTVFPSITKVDITKDELDVFVDDSEAMPAVTGETAAGATQDIGKLAEWTSSDPTIVSIGDDGKWKALKTGTATLTAKVYNEAGEITGVRSDTIVIEVHNKLLGLDSSVSAISVVTGKEADLPAVTAIYENGDEETITDKIVWKASSANLLVKAPKIKGLKASSVTLTGTYLSKTVTVKVTIEEEFTSFLITPTGVQLTLNKSQTIKVTATTKSGKKVSIGTRLEWAASVPDLVTIKGASIKGLKEGTGKLTATIQGKTLEVPYTVTAKLTKLTVSEKSIKLQPIGSASSVTLTADYENGKSVNATDGATWTTSNAKVATVKEGKITFVGKGSATIKAAFGGKTATVSVSAK